MKRFSLIGIGLLALAAGGAGCSHLPFLRHKHKAEKMSGHVATDTEKEFRDRWVDKRAGELISQGQSSESARSQAEREFLNTFPATTVAQPRR